MRIAMMADSSSGISQAEAKELGVYVAPVPVYIDDELFYEDLTITQPQFYERIKTAVGISTSQPNPQAVGEMWADLLKDHEAVVYVPISSGLSETGHNLAALAENDERFNGKVFVVDNHRVSITQRQSVLDGLKMAKEGKTAKQIYDKLTETAMSASIYIMVDTLKYLKKSGRLTPAAAAIGTLLKIKPILQCQGESMDRFATVRSTAAAKAKMISALKNDLETRFKKETDEGKMIIGIAYTDNLAEAERFREEVIAAILNVEFATIKPLSLSVASHIGSGALGLGCCVRY